VCALAFAGLGLGASLASLVDYLGPTATFCAASGCETVRASAWAHPLGIPMPLFGVLCFGAMFALALVARPRVRLGLALAGGAVGVCLIAVQALVIGAWCKLCLVSDVSAVAVALAVSAGATTVRMTAARALIAATCVAAIPLAFTAIALSAANTPAPDAGASTGGPVAAAAVPDVIARAQTPGTVTVVEFVDFECPFCRRLAPALAAAVHDAAATVPVTVVRKMVPLPMHAHARTAALAWCCADAQGKGDAMAEALFDAPVDELTPEGCERLAERVGCDVARYRDAFADPATAQRVDDELASAKAANAEALPTVFVGAQRFTGANHDAAELLAAIDQAAR